MATAILNSNGGYESLSLIKSASDSDADGKWLVLDFVTNKTVAPDGTQPEVVFELKMVSVLAKPLEELAQAIGDWLKLPLTSQSKTSFNTSCELGRLYGESLLLEFGDRADLITDGGKQVFTLMLRRGRCVSRSLS